jgi:DNA processing protein
VPGHDEFAAWFRLLETPGLGRDTARRLLSSCGSPAAVLGARHATLRELVGPALADALVRPGPDFAPRLDAAQHWLAGSADRHALTLGHPAWPPMLLQTADPPLLLFVQGDLACLAKPAVAVVGSRRPTAQGADNAMAFAKALGAQGWTIVSGLAQGVDGAAHEGALAAGAATVAVMGSGPDRIYPPRHRGLAHRIVAAGGALVTEYAPGTPPLPNHFPQRNRIIAALAQGTLVVEAALRSGSLITARLASEAGRDVFAIPGSIHSSQSQGCHALIKQGAKLVETAHDITDELRGVGAPAQASLALDAPADPLLDALGHDPVTLDALMARTGWPVQDLSAKLLEYELDGRVARLPGGLFQQRHAG